MTLSKMTFTEAQTDLRIAFAGGGYGAVISGLIWLLAAATLNFVGFDIAIIVFFIGGMVIYPLSTVVAKAVGKCRVPDPDNPFLKMGFQLTMILFVGLFIAYVLAKDSPMLFFAVMAMIIGARYVPFATLYGLAMYWALGLILMAIGMVSCLILSPSATAIAAAVGVTEIAFGVIFLRKSKT